MNNKYRLFAETEQMPGFFSPLVKEEQSWFALCGSVFHILTVLKNNTGFYLSAFDPKKLLTLSEMPVHISQYPQMSTDVAQDAYAISVPEQVEC